MTVMKISQTLALVFVVACTSATVAPRAQASPDVRVFQNPDESAITEGETVLATDPDTAYRVATDYMRWPTMFPDIKRVIITSQAAGHDRVTFIHTEGNRDNVHFHNRPQARMVWFEDTGGRAEVWFEIMFMPGMQAGTTRVHARLYADVHGWASLFVSDDKIRSMREQRVRDDLGHLRAFFAHDVASQPAPSERNPAPTGSM
ncbi:MAG TPA: SRPBCC family protein [Kofleriaceae bacterium]|jgi:hypothetical protein